MPDATDKAREEFFSEANEIIEGMSRDLLALEEGRKKGQSDPEIVNNIFRGVHTLKGLTGLFGVTRMSALSHELENLLDDLRLGRIALGEDVLDLLFRALDLFGRLLAAEKGTREDALVDLEPYLRDLSRISSPETPAAELPTAEYDLDPGLLAVLTEYEEHRLRANIEQGQNLFRMRAAFALLTIDEDLSALKTRAKPYGEIITYLPTGDGTAADSIELDILMAGSTTLEPLRAALQTKQIRVEQIPRRRTAEGEREAARARARASERPRSEMPPELGRGNFSQRDPRRDDPRKSPMGDDLRKSSSDDEPSSSGTGDEHLRSSTGRAARFDSSSPRAPSQPPGHTTSPGARMGMRVPEATGDDRSVLPRASRDSKAMGPQLVEGVSLRSISQTVRVDIRRLDLLMNMVGELSIVKNTMGKLTDRLRKSAETRVLATEIDRLHRSFDRHLSEIQGGILEVRMVPLGQVFDKLARVVRQISRELGKEVNLVITGAETEVDKLIVEELSDPLMHMIRNAIDHGIESRVEREQVGKPTVGTIALNAFQKASHVVIEIEDDGHGLNETKLVAAASRRGLMNDDQLRELERPGILNLIFLPGLTTRSDVGELSGRGVGMDVVKTNIAKLGGVVDVYSEAGIGTKFTVTLPITLAIISALILRVGSRTFAIPLSSIHEAIWLDPAAVRRVEGREVMTQRGATLLLCRLREHFGIGGDGADAASPTARPYAVVVGVGAKRLGLVVDELIGQQDIVVKSLGPSLRGVRGFSGASELGDQRIALVVDAATLLEEILSTPVTPVLAEGAMAHG